MNKTLMVSRHELLTTLRRRSYQVVSFGLPLLGVGILFVVTLIRGATGSGTEVEDPGAPAELKTEGFVDLSGLIEAVPDDLPLLRFADEAAAQEALSAGEIEAYYVVPAEYLQSGELVYVHPDLTPMSSHGQDWIMRRALVVNLVSGDVELADRVWNPMYLEMTDLSAVEAGDDVTSGGCSGANCESSLVATILPMIMVVMLFMFITLGASLILRNISAEKENRLIEIMMLSVSPRQLLTGKLIGLGAASFLASLAWLGSVYLSLTIGGTALNLPTGFSLPPSVLFWAALYFLLGYALYASLMAGAGALVPKIKEVTTASWVVIAPLMVGYMVGIIAYRTAPHELLSTALSIFPLTAPVVMVMRLTVGGVPLWQLLLSAALMVLTAVLVVRLVARTFRAQSLLSGEPFSLRRYVDVLLNRS